MSGNIGAPSDAGEKPISEVEQVETVPSTEEKAVVTSGNTNEHSNIFVRFWHSIYQKPTKRQNVWKLLTNLNNTQRITFTAGNLKCTCTCNFNIDPHYLQPSLAGPWMHLIFFLSRYLLHV